LGNYHYTEVEIGIAWGY